MPYKTFQNWLFNGSLKTEIPKPKISEDGKVIVPDILKYNSPITHIYIISLFLKHGPLNHYLNSYLNNIGLRYLDKEELFKFVKKCVIDFRVNKRDIVFFYPSRKDKLFVELRKRFATFKNEDIDLLSDMINKTPERDNIYAALGIEKPKKEKVKKQNKKDSKISLKNFIHENFSIMKMK